MYHFNTPVQDYFPWYTYSNSILEPPTINDEVRKIYINALPQNFSQLLNVWFGERSYDEEQFIQNRQLVQNQGITFFRTGLEFMSDKQIGVNLSKNLAHLSLKNDIIHFSVDNWLEVEKQRLFYLLGVREKAQEYLNLLKTISELNEIVDYHKTNLNDINLDFNVEITNFENLTNRDISLDENLSPDMVVETIRNYSGDTNFYKSLKDYLLNKGSLTPKQIEAASKTIVSEMMKMKSKSICLKINESVVYGDRQKVDEINSLIYRMQKMGFKTNSTYDFTIIYK